MVYMLTFASTLTLLLLVMPCYAVVCVSFFFNRNVFCGRSSTFCFSWPLFVPSAITAACCNDTDVVRGTCGYVVEGRGGVGIG